MAEAKIKMTVSFTPRVVKAGNIEAKRLGISFADVMRRWLDPHADEVFAKMPPTLKGKVYGQP